MLEGEVRSMLVQPRLFREEDAGCWPCGEVMGILEAMVGGGPNTEDVEFCITSDANSNSNSLIWR